MLCAFVESMSQSMRNQHAIHKTKQLAAALKEHRSEYSEEFLDRVLDHLYDNEREARRFFIKSKEGQQRYITKLVNDQGWPDS